MTSSKDTETTASEVEEFRTLVTATGLPEHVAAELLRSDQDLDELCDTVLSMFAAERKKVNTTGR